MQELVREYLNELGEKQKKRRRVRIIASLFAVVVIGSVAWSLIQSGIAMTGQPKCGMEEHTHGDGCYSNTLACGQEESAGHTHSEACYQTTQTLICGQEESEEHAHSEACYQTEQTLICGQEEAAGHTHTDACYSRQLTCGKQEHIHTDACFVDNNADVEDASKWDAQYADIEWKDAWGEDLVIAAKEQLDYKESVENYITGEDGSHKGYSRYGQFAGESYIDWDMAFVNFCMHYAGLDESKMFPEEKTTKEWYDKFVEADEGKNKVYLTAPEGYEPKEGDLIFTKRENEETELQAGIISSYDKEKNEIKVIEGNSENRVKENTYAIDDKYISEYLMIGEMEKEYKKQDNETAVGTTDETETDGEEPTNQTEIPAGSIEKVYTDGTIIVRASYEADAEIPEEAELIAEQITAEGNEEHYAEREAEFRETLENDEAVMKALLKIGFYVNGEEVEPKSTVTITVQFLDENGLAEGKPVTIVHFADKGAEVLDGSKANNNSTTFQTESFSEYAFTDDELDGAGSGDKRPIDRTFRYEDELFQIVFTVTGNVVLTDEDMSEEMEKAADAETVVKEGEAKETAEKYLLKVKRLDDSSDEYSIFADPIEGIDDGCEQLLFQVIQYGLYYEGKKLDLSDCDTVTANVIPTEKLKERAAEALENTLHGEGDNPKGEEDPADETGTETMNTFSISRMADTSANNEANLLGEADDMNVAESYEGLLTGERATESGAILRAYVQRNEKVVEENNMSLTSDDAEDGMSVSLPDDVFALEVEIQIANPHFTVQYYANLETVAYNDDSLKEVTAGTTNTNELPVIDTNGGKMPKNGGGTTASPNGNAIRNIYVDPTTGKLKTKTELTEVYTSRPYEYCKAPTINYMNALIENPDYELKEIWVLKEGASEKSIARTDWDIYTYSADLHFTNRLESSEEDAEYILIREDTMLRFVYDTTTKDNEFEAAFYDYDLGDGKIYSSQSAAKNQSGGQSTSSQGTGTWYMYTNQAGINSSSNYTGSGAKLAFGNANTGSGLQHEDWLGNLLNKHNGTQSGHPLVTGSYKGCTFGLATGLSGGKVQYASGVNVPNLFNEGSAAGKTAYDKNQYSLTFNRVGDTYTLTTVNGTGTGNLDTFNHPSPKPDKVHTHIWTNNFWPMDSAPSYGTDGHDMKFGDINNVSKNNFAGAAGSGGGSAVANGNFPNSDDGLDHNSYFGMHYKVEFDLDAEYVGPLEYYFFGDDDMWVFLDNKLVCDIGGVHSSVGEYVNLWDYLEKGSSGKHTLSFFYTERGESGSTCWMQFTLPSVSSLTPEKSSGDYGKIRIEKTVNLTEDGEEQAYSGNQKFDFTIILKDKDGNPLRDDYSYIKGQINSEAEGESNIILHNHLYNGAHFSLKNNEYIEIKYLPAGAQYEIIENTASIKVGKVNYACNTEVSKEESRYVITQKGADGKDTAVNKLESTGAISSEGNTVSGTIPSDSDGSVSSDKEAEIKYTNKASVYKLPSTGGPGIYMYMFSGMLLILGASLITYRKKCRGVSGS